MFIFYAPVPPPSVTVTSSPEDLYAATDASLTLTCTVDFDPSLSSYANVSLTWIKGSTPLSNISNRISMLSALEDSQFTSNITLFPLSAKDSENFTCRAGIIPSNNETLVTASDLVEETVEVTVQGWYTYTFVDHLIR